MRKLQAKKTIADRGPTRYSKCTVAVLQKLLDLIHVPDHRTGDVEQYWSRPMTLDKIAFYINFHPRTVRRSIDILKHDGIITEHGEFPGSYHIEAERLKQLDSRFLQRTCRRLWEKIANLINMRVARWDGLAGRAFQFAPEHPQVSNGKNPKGYTEPECACEGFCSHPFTDGKPHAVAA